MVAGEETWFSEMGTVEDFLKCVSPKKERKCFVSAACGSVGYVVSQYAKLFGCYFVGCAGTKHKVAMLKEKLGFDEAFNYKEETDLKPALKRYFPDGIDIYFHNVGSEMLEVATANMKDFGRVAACGVISEYTDAGKRAATDMINSDFLHLYSDFLSTTCDQLRSGKIRALEDVSRV